MTLRAAATLFLVFLPLFSSIAARATAVDAFPRRGSYADIPGVTQEEMAAIERLKRLRPEGISYAMMHSDVSFIGANGEIAGFTHLFCEKISDIFGIRVTPRLVDWGTLVAGLDSREFDLSGELTATPRRRAKYRMTTPITERGFMVLRSADRDDLDLINGKETLRYGFLKNSETYNRVNKTSAVPFTAYFADSVEEAAEAVRGGVIDAFVSEGRMDSLFENQTGFVYQEYYPLLYTSVSLATGNPDLFPIVDVFQKFLDNGGDAVISDLQTEGEFEYLRHKFLKQLNGEEKRYLEDHIQSGKAVALAAEHDNYPASFFNKREGEWQGIAHDILAEIARITGLRFEVVNNTDATWLSLQETLENGDAAMVTELLPTKTRQGRFLWPQFPYMTDEFAFLSREDAPNITMHQVFDSRVGLIRGSAHEEAFHQVFPDHTKFVAFGNATEGFEALENGEIDLVLMTKNLLLSITNYSERPGFKINISLNLPSNSYFGFNNKEATLRDIVDKAQKIVDCESIAERWRRKTFDYKGKLAQARIPYLVSIFALVLLVLTLLLALSRKKERLSRRLSMIDHLTRIANRRHFDKRIRDEWEKSMRERLCVSLLAIDIDHFKRCNDAYGHPQGDLVLCAVARTLGNSMQRCTDLAARTGGEEFSVLLPNTNADGALLVAERIRADVEKTAVRNLAGGPAINVTISVGVATARPAPGGCVNDLVSSADHALYAAKQGGRNRVCVA